MRLLIQAMHLWRTRIGIGLAVFILLVALVGPLLAPYSPTALPGAPYAAPSGHSLLGTDYLGEDVLSHLLYGGRTVIWMSLVTATLAEVIGVPIGMMAAFSRSRLDDVLMRGMDVLLALPAIVLALTVVSLLGPNPWLIVAAVAWTWIPGVARVARGATLEVVRREHIEAVEAIGLPTWRILLREVLPNISTPILIDYGTRITWATGTIAALSFIGAGVQPPNADWGLMINQNQAGLAIQPWALLAPVACIGLWALGTNMITEGLSQAAALVDRSRSEA